MIALHEGVIAREHVHADGLLRSPAINRSALVDRSGQRFLHRRDVPFGITLVSYHNHRRVGLPLGVATIQIKLLDANGSCSCLNNSSC